jgi:hypothetical protein
MSWILVTAILVGAPAPAVLQRTPPEALAEIGDDVQTGSLIISKGDCLAIKIYSASTYTHVAAVVVNDGQACVYDATGGAGVRRQSLGDYLVAQSDNTLYLFHPFQPFTKRRASRFEEHLKSQIGRPYAIHHHLTGERAAGLHCSEYVCDALIAAETLHARQPSRVSPASLVEGILQADVYQPGDVVRLVPMPPARPESQSWCARLWFDTKQCTHACCSKLRGWFLCK